MPEKQTYANHVRWYPFVHFIVVPLLLLNFIYLAVRLYQEPSWDRAILTIFCFVVILIVPSARLQALKAQDRLIRLEERLRYDELLSAEMGAQASGLNVGNALPLRVAPDGELPSPGGRT